MAHTNLSEYVHQMIVKCGQNETDCSNGYITPQLTYDWHEIEVAFGDIPEDFNVLEQTDVWYLTRAELVWSIVHSAGVAMKKATSCERETLGQLCDWAHCCQHDVTEYLLWTQQEPDIGTLLAVLHLTASLERALGNVYLMKNQPVPFLLRDLLQTAELKNLFGKVPILFTQLLLGCPKGLNLRNVVWHGFTSPGELHPHLVCGLMVLIASLGALLPRYQAITKRPQFASYEKYKDHLCGVFPDVMHSTDDVVAILESSPNVSEHLRILWRRAFELFQCKRFGDSLVLLLPQMEHSLRVLYCRVNDCPARLLTAEATTLYTTLDEILAPSTQPVVREGLLMALLDLTSSLSGPRLRDRVSHGECDLDLLPQWMINHVFCVALLVTHYQEQNECCNIPLCSRLRSAVSVYRSQFHIIATLRHGIEQLLEGWQGWQHCPQPLDLPDSPPQLSCPHIQGLDRILFPQAKGVLGRVDRMKQCLQNAEPPTLFRPRGELELASSLLLVVDNLRQTAIKIHDTAYSRRLQWDSRTLRSRARATCQRMWTVLPDLWTALLCALMVAVLSYRALPSLAQLGKQATRLVKCLTKSMSNTVTMCDEDKNRWMEAHDLVSSMASSLSTWLAQHHNVLLSS